MASITPHRKRNPRKCDLCAPIRKTVATNIVKFDGHPSLYVCEEHTAYIRKTYGLE